MPRVSREQAELHRAAIEDAAARLFRERGLRGVSVAEVMADVGLTHGGFYGHFESKDALAAVACDKAFAQSVARWRQRIGAQHGPADARAALVEGYLSPRSCASLGGGCAAASLAVDVAREPADASVHAHFCDGVDALLQILASVQATGDDALDRRQAAADLSTMVGALVLARATAGDPMSRQFLAAARAHLLPAGAPAA